MANAKHPLISIVIPVYNVERYLDECLRSIKEQSFEDYEVICVDDGSTDKSIEILNDWAHKDSRYVIVCNSHTGVSLARNVGIEKARGDYIVFIDSDDYIDQDYLIDLLDAINQDNSDVAVTRTRHVRQRRQWIEPLPNPHPQTFLERMALLPNGACWNKIYKKTFLQEHRIDFLPHALFQDSLFTIIVCYYAKNFAVAQNGSCYNYRKVPSGIVQGMKKTEQRKQDSLIITKAIFDFALKNNFSYQEKRFLGTFCMKHIVMKRLLVETSYYKEVLKILAPANMAYAIKKARYLKMLKHVFCFRFLGGLICLDRVNAKDQR